MKPDSGSMSEPKTFARKVLSEWAAAVVQLAGPHAREPERPTPTKEASCRAGGAKP